jgi:CheY-like chemotaxis protein
LVVEDDPLLLLHAMMVIEDAGFDVVPAANADRAIEILTLRTDIRIVVTDIDMPGSMDGMKLAAFVRHRWPPIELIVTSGHRHPPDDELPERGLFFPKPWDEPKITAALHDFAKGFGGSSP